MILRYGDSLAIERVQTCTLLDLIIHVHVCGSLLSSPLFRADQGLNIGHNQALIDVDGDTCTACCQAWSEDRSCATTKLETNTSAPTQHLQTTSQEVVASLKRPSPCKPWWRHSQVCIWHVVIHHQIERLHPQASKKEMHSPPKWTKEESSLFYASWIA